jgi:hypothetical protein
VCYSHLRQIVGDSPAVGKQETCLWQTFGGPAGLACGSRAALSAAGHWPD